MAPTMVRAKASQSRPSATRTAVPREDVFIGSALHFVLALRSSVYATGPKGASGETRRGTHRHGGGRRSSHREGSHHTERDIAVALEPTDLSDEFGDISAVEPPARRAVWLLTSDPEGDMECAAIAVPGRWSGARRAIRGGARVALDCGRPPLLAIQRGQPL